MSPEFKDLTRSKKSHIIQCLSENKVSKMLKIEGSSIKIELKSP